MTETYCGKSCDDCKEKTALTCYGCKSGPGRPNSGECRIAKCCRSKGHQECATCNFSAGCSTLRAKDCMSEMRLNEKAAKKAKAAALKEEAHFFGKWIWVLFWLFIPSTIANVMEVIPIPVLATVGVVLAAVCALAYDLILIMLGQRERRYRIAGICMLIHSVFIIISGGAGLALIKIAVGIVGLVGMYYEYTAHACAIAEFDGDLAEKWMGLWKWHVRLFGAMIAGVVLAILSTTLGLLVTLAGSVGFVVVGIAKLSYLFKTAGAFTDYAYDPEAEQI